MKPGPTGGGVTFFQIFVLVRVCPYGTLGNGRGPAPSNPDTFSMRQSGHRICRPHRRPRCIISDSWNGVVRRPMYCDEMRCSSGFIVRWCLAVSCPYNRLLISGSFRDSDCVFKHLERFRQFRARREPVVQVRLDTKPSIGWLGVRRHRAVAVDVDRRQFPPIRPSPKRHDDVSNSLVLRRLLLLLDRIDINARRGRMVET